MEDGQIAENYHINCNINIGFHLIQSSSQLIIRISHIAKIKRNLLQINLYTIRVEISLVTINQRTRQGSEILITEHI